MTDTMVRTLSPRQAQALIAEGDVDVVDVRAAADWWGGHIPEARSVPLAELTADPRGALSRDGVVFVCARGVRSLTAARAAAAAGFERVYSIDGGTLGWSGEGLPLVGGGS